MADTVTVPFTCAYSKGRQGSIQIPGEPPPVCEQPPGEPQWAAEGIVVPELDANHELINKILVTNGEGSCPSCGFSGTADTSGLRDDLKTATVAIS